MIWLLLFLLNFGSLVDLSNSFDLRDGHSSENNLIGEICQSKHIRFTVDDLIQLKNCSVIEGHLMISYIYPDFNGSSLEGLEFPLLTEVTDYVLLCYVSGFTSLGKLFPNLRVIRGNYLIDNYALIVYEMTHLQEIGLKSLTKISRGSVRIENNPMLCFVDTIEWSLITSGGKNNVIKKNRAANDCPTCALVGKSTKDTRLLMCPELNGKNLCWNQSNCQQLCPSKCGNSTCNVKGDCCDDSCVGCDEAGKCLSCRHLSIGNSKDLQCVKICPSNMFSYENYRCVTESECRAIKQPIFVEDRMLAYPYIPHDGECSTVCPNNFRPDKLFGHRKCMQCVGTCNKFCPPGGIYSISSAQRYRGCTHISGQLVIKNLDDQSVVRELENSLSEIEEIEGNLVIEQSHSIVSLGFFKKLRLVKNNPMGQETYGIKVIGNLNLRALFTHNVTIEHGRMFFHFNPKLRLNVIEELKLDMIDLRSESSLNDDEVAPDTNGNEIAFDIVTLNIEIKEINANNVVMELVPLVPLGYLIYYKPAPNRNVTMFDGSDVCGKDGWQVVDVPDSIRNSTPINVSVTQLKPETRYAYYIQTYIVANERHVDLTKIQYFRTSSELTLNPSVTAVVGLESSFHCPRNFYRNVSSGDRACVPCVGICEKVCPPGHIDGILTAQRYHGCTYIAGQLVIHIRNPAPNTVRELEKSLSEIEVIEGSLIIKRSYPLVSLGFFKKLRLVKNDPLGNEKYGIKVIGNQNLRALFTHNVTIEHGRMLFHFNPKLCLNVIEELKLNVMDLRSESSLTNDEVASDTNGDKTSCNMKELNAEINRIDYDSVVIQFEPVLYDDSRSLLGYLMYYKPTPFQNVTMFDGIDACGDDGWQVKEILDRNRNRKSTPILFNVTHLKPDTQYAYYIRTWTIDSEEYGGSTLVKYFRTGPYKAGTTRSSADVDSSSEINNRLDPSVRNRERSWLYVEDAEESIAFENAVQNAIYVRRRIVVTGDIY
ncbi:insulin-like receptor [Bradysia coprophila]|uniref:insulin-like receptor n=1 Tax=Bradysia coprophila TaxID=38358 RepID=UPI00187D8FCA|nr:insulin-like receptor [Bradysia coprophila]